MLLKDYIEEFVNSPAPVTEITVESTECMICKSELEIRSESNNHDHTGVYYCHCLECEELRDVDYSYE